ncbi:MAG: hypothetical protein KF727_01965 [Microbacteriaceae bacterium]|nr:hypothetical protein [Microbacteriaceae bacterium]
MSNGRRPATGNRYRTGYLRSPAWFRRRDQWFTEQTARTEELRCVVCWQVAVRRDLELHHLDYRRVACDRGRWRAGEEHEDLCAMHPGCHELVHGIIEADPVLRRHRSRPIATVHAIRVARARRAAHAEAQS